MEVGAFAVFSNFCLGLQRLKKRAKDTVIEDLNPTSDFNIALNNSIKRRQINPFHGLYGFPSNRSIIAYQEVGIMVIFDHFQSLDKYWLNTALALIRPAAGARPI